MSNTALFDFYRSAHVRCAYQDGAIPEPRSIQELVQAWKEVRKMKP